MTALINKNAKEKAPKLAQGGLAFGPTYEMMGDNSNARVDPEVIAPLSKLKNLMTGGGTANVNITLSGELKAKGATSFTLSEKKTLKRTFWEDEYYKFCSMISTSFLTLTINSGENSTVSLVVLGIYAIRSIWTHLDTVSNSAIVLKPSNLSNFLFATIAKSISISRIALTRRIFQ